MTIYLSYYIQSPLTTYHIGITMRTLLSILILVLFCSSAHAGSATVDMLKKNGSTIHANTMNKASEYIEFGSHRSFLQFNTSNIDKHLASSVVINSFDDNDQLNIAIFSPNNNGTGDLSYARIFYSSKSVAQLRTELFHDWKFDGTYGKTIKLVHNGMEIYMIPQPLGTLYVKTETVFDVQ